ANGDELYVGGAFTMPGGGHATHLAKWTGNAWSAIDYGTDDFVTALAVNGSDLYIGLYNYFAISTANYIIKWNGTTSLLGSGTNDAVNALVVNGGSLYAGGAFTMAGGKPSYHIGRWTICGNGVVDAGEQCDDGNTQDGDCCSS